MPTVRKFFGEFWARTCDSTKSRRVRDAEACVEDVRTGEWRRISALGALTDPGREFLDVIEDLAAFCHRSADLLLGVHDGRVITTERLTDFGQRQVGELAAQIHGDLTGLRECTGLTRPA